MGILNMAQPMASTLGFSIKMVIEIVNNGYKGLKIILNDRTNESGLDKYMVVSCVWCT
jgi:hypothetical protein